jgi:hypothetical protein
MKVQEIMERAGIQQTGRAIAYIKDALEEMNMISETNIDTERINIVSGQRFYDLPRNMIKLLDIRCKDHNNEDSTYRSIPRMIHEPAIEDTDGS